MFALDLYRLFLECSNMAYYTEPLHISQDASHSVIGSSYVLHEKDWISRAPDLDE
jgi:hypothetical protein